MSWTEKRDGIGSGWRYVRGDGATVKWHGGPSRLQWLAYEPDPSENYLSRTNGRLIWPRRWATAEAAMRAVDREYPEVR